MLDRHSRNTMTISLMRFLIQGTSRISETASPKCRINKKPSIAEGRIAYQLYTHAMRVSRYRVYAGFCGSRLEMRL